MLGWKHMASIMVKYTIMKKLLILLLFIPTLAFGQIDGKYIPYLFGKAMRVDLSNIQPFRYEPEAIALFARMPDTVPTDRRLIINATIKRLKDEGIYDSIYVLQVYASNTPGNSLVNWIGNYCNATTNSNTNFSDGIGWSGDDAAAHVNTQYPHNDLTKLTSTSNQHIVYFHNIGKLDANDVGFGMFTGVQTTSTFWIMRNSVDRWNGRFAGIAITLTNPTASTGWFSNRLRNDTLVIDNNGHKIIYPTVTPSFTSSLKYTINARNTSTTPAAHAMTTASLYCATKALSDQQYSDFMDIMNEYFAASVQFSYTSVKELGAREATADNFTIIQNLINSSNKIYIPTAISSSDTFKISQPLYLGDRDTLLVNGNLKIKNGTTPTPLVADMMTGVPYARVTSTAGFNVGEHVTISDNDNILQTGGTGQTRRVGSGGIIRRINGDTIFLNTTSLYDNTVAQSARLGHFQGLIYMENADSCQVWGKGSLHGNWRNQYDAYGVGRHDSTGIALEYFAQVIGIAKSSYTTIKGLSQSEKLYITGGGVCGISSYRRDNLFSTGHLIENVWSDANHDKNLLFGYVNNCTIRNYTGSRAVFEDGLINYLHCDNITIDSANLWGNNRYGLSWNSDYNDTLNATRITTMGNGTGIHIASHVANITDALVYDNVGLLDNYSPRGITLTNVNILNSTKDYPLAIQGFVERATINNLTITNCTGTAAIRVIANYGSPATCPVDISFNGGGIYNFTGNTTEIDASCEDNVTFTDFEGL